MRDSSQVSERSRLFNLINPTFEHLSMKKILCVY